MELRVNNMKRVMLCREVYGGIFVVSLRMNASKKKRFCLCCLSLLAVDGSRDMFCRADLLESAPFLPGCGTTAAYSNTGGCFV